MCAELVHRVFKFYLTGILLLNVIVCGKHVKYNVHLSDRLIKDLYDKYKEAVSNNADLVILRRQFDHNRLFEIHVKKLKEVNGFKQHNLMIRGRPRSGRNPFIYINNPVESKLPNAYLTLEEFKEALTKRIEKQREEITTKKKHIILLSADRITRKHKVTRTTIPDSMQTQLSDRNDISKFLSSLYGLNKKEVQRASEIDFDKKIEKKAPDSSAFLNDTTESFNSSSNGTVKEIAESFTDILVTEKPVEVETTNDLESTHAEDKFDILLSEVFNKTVGETVKTTKGIEPVEVTRTSPTVLPYTEVRTTIQVIEPKIYYSTNLKSVTTGQVGTNKEELSTTAVPMETKPSLLDYSKEAIKESPQLIEHTETTARQTPKRKSTLNKQIIKNKSIITSRSTLGRPLVFIGGP